MLSYFDTTTDHYIKQKKKKYKVFSIDIQLSNNAYKKIKI